MIRLAWRLAWRDLHGRKTGLIIVMLCLALGVATIAGIFSLRAALTQGLAESSREIIGGDLELATGIGPFPASVPAWFTGHGARLSQTIDTRSILIAPSGRRILVAARAVFPTWPLLGQVTTIPANQFAALAHGPDGQPGLILDPSAAASLGLRPGDKITLGGIPLSYRGRILAAPDSLGDSQLFGAKAFVPAAALAGTPLVEPSGLVTFTLQVLLRPGASVAQTQADFEKSFPNNPWRLRKAADAAPDLTRFISQAAMFMTLLGLAALLVGGIGVANGIEAWLTARAQSIATLRCLGATARMVSLIYGLQLLTLGVPGIVLGLAAGAAAPLAVLPLLRGKLPVPAHLALYPAPLVLAGLSGLAVALVFAQPILRRAAAIPGAALFRLAGLPARLPFSWRAGSIQSLASLVLIALTLISVQSSRIALGFCAAAILTLSLLRGIAALVIRALPLLPAPRDAALALGLRRLHGPASSLRLLLLSAGTGLTVLVAVAEIRANLLASFTGALPATAPSLYFIDIQPPDLPLFEATLAKTGATSSLRIMPSLRARILAIRGVPVDRFHPPASSDWPLCTDIGFTFAAAPPPGAALARGAWWPAGYLGPPLVSLDSDIAHEWGVSIGDALTINVLGRTFTLRIANLRKIDWQSLQLNFLMVGTPDPFAGAPYTIVATVKTSPGRTGDVLAAVTSALPTVTAIDVEQVLAAFAGLLKEIATAISVVGLIALAAGLLVLVSAAAAEREARIAEAVILKTLGANRAQIRRAWLAEFAVAGGIAAMVAALLGTAAAGLTISQVFHTSWHFQPAIMLLTLAASIGFMLIFGYATTAHALREPAAPRLRLQAGS
jgi:putative ABC transport system permease protein